MLKNISTEWKESLRYNSDNEVRMYIDPRRVEYAPYTGTETYYENTANDPVNGQYSLAQSTSVYTIPFSYPITFEVMFKPNFGSDIASDQEFFKFYSDLAFKSKVALCYYSGSDQLGVKCYSELGGVDQIDTKLAHVYLDNFDLKQWHRITVVINSSTIKIYNNGRALVTTTDSISTHSAKVIFSPSNDTNIYINYGLIYYGYEATQSDILNRYKGIKNECLFLNFQGVGLARTRCDITSYINSFGLENSNAISAANFNMNILDTNGAFASDQFLSFSPENGSYNGLITENYLVKNQLGISAEYRSKQKDGINTGLIAFHSMDEVPDIPDNVAGKIENITDFSSSTGWAFDGGAGSIIFNSEQIHIIAIASNSLYRTATYGANAQFFIKIKTKAPTISAIYHNGITYVTTASKAVLYDQWTIVSFNLPDAVTSKAYGLATVGATYTADIKGWYLGTGAYDSRILDSSGSNYNGSIVAASAYPGISGKGLDFNKYTAYCLIPNSYPSLWTRNIWTKTRSSDASPRFIYATIASWATNGEGFYIENNQYNFLISDQAGNTKGFSFQNTLVGNDWFMFSVIYKGYGNTIDFYINGIFNQSVSISNLINNPNSTSLYLGKQPDYYFYDGQIDEHKMFNYCLTATEIKQLYDDGISENKFNLTSDSNFEQIFYGTCDNESLNRSTSVGSIASLSITATDQFKQIAFRNIRNGKSFEDYYLSRATSSNNSILHELLWLATKKEIYNYCGNSSFENTTVGNSWLGSGTSVSVTRNANASLYGTYSGLLTGTGFLYILQYITIEVSKGDVFTFQIYELSAGANSFAIEILEYVDSTPGDSTLNSYSSTNYNWQHLSCTHTCTNSSTNKLAIVIGTDSIETYFDMAMLTRGGLKYFYVLNSNDGTSGTISETLAMSTSYSTLGIKTENISYQHPWLYLEKGSSIIDHLKMYSDAMLTRRFFINNAGVLNVNSHLVSNVTTYPVAEIEDVNSLSSGISSIANKINVQGVYIKKDPEVSTIWEAKVSAPDSEATAATNFLYIFEPDEYYPDITDYPDGLACEYGFMKTEEEKKVDYNYKYRKLIQQNSRNTLDVIDGKIVKVPAVIPYTSPKITPNLKTGGQQTEGLTPGSTATARG